MLLKLSNLNSNLALTLGYLNPALNNSAQGFKQECTGIFQQSFSVCCTVLTSNKNEKLEF